jgi:hypothetical protein
MQTSLMKDVSRVSLELRPDRQGSHAPGYSPDFLYNALRIKLSDFGNSEQFPPIGIRDVRLCGSENATTFPGDIIFRNSKK